MKVSIVILAIFVVVTTGQFVSEKSERDRTCEKRVCPGNQVGRSYGSKCICECPNLSQKCCEQAELFKFFDPTWCSWNLTSSNEFISTISDSAKVLTAPTAAVLNSISTIAPTLAPLALDSATTLNTIITAVAPPIISWFATVSDSASDLKPLVTKFVEAATNYTYEQATCCV